MRPKSWSSKGVELNFVWIFGILGGIVLLSLFIMMATRFSDTARTSGAAEELSLVSSLLSSTISSEGKASTIPLKSMRVECQSGSIVMGQDRQTFPTTVLYGIPLIEGEVRAWSKVHARPFEAYNRLYLFPAKARILIVHESADASSVQELRYQIPSEVPVDLVTPSQAQLSDDTYAVYINSVAPPGPGVVVEWLPAQRLVRTQGGAVNAIYVEEVIGALASGRSFSCAQALAGEKEAAIATLLSARASAIGSTYPSGPCKDAFDEAQAILSAFTPDSREPLLTIQQQALNNGCANIY